MSGYPPYVPANELASVEDRLQAERENAREQYEEYVAALAADDLEEAVQAKRNYQLAAHQRRQVEGEIVWAVLGYAIADIADRVAPDHDAVPERGRGFVQWATDTDRLRSVRGRKRIELIVVRRSPTLPTAHAEYVEVMFGMDEADISRARERDRTMLEQAGWTRRGQSSSDPIAERPCPECGNQFVIRASDPEGVVLQTEYMSDVDLTREICPHCDADLYVER